MNLRLEPGIFKFVNIWILATNLTDDDKDMMKNMDSDYGYKCCYSGGSDGGFENRFVKQDKWIAMRIVNYRKP